MFMTQIEVEILKQCKITYKPFHLYNRLSREHFGALVLGNLDCELFSLLFH